MKTSTIVWIVVVAVIVVGVGWYVAANAPAAPASPAGATQTTQDQSNPNYTPGGTASSSSQTTTETPVVGIGTSATLGSYLVTGSGMTLYKYAKDTPGVSNCVGSCATTWLPYTPSGSVLSGAAQVTGTLGTVTRADSTVQLTYNTAPLYAYSKDQKSGDTNGQNVSNLWSVVKP